MIAVFNNKSLCQEMQVDITCWNTNASIYLLMRVEAYVDPDNQYLVKNKFNGRKTWASIDNANSS